ncbi:unnamed protein product [Durusdinium trenchii]|uniref:Transcription factor TFIIIC triple barrel domain-containing protein n=1 Tax=Durusdinium trenchii TaxID=1381693 RepID=A0ABP0RH06_9DINO
MSSASWADTPVGEEVLVLCKFPQLENSEFFKNASSFQIEGLEGPLPRLVVDGAWRFKGQHSRPMSSNLFFSEDARSTSSLAGASPHVVHFELDRSNMASRMDRVLSGMSEIRAGKLEPEEPEEIPQEQAEIEVQEVQAAGAGDSDKTLQDAGCPFSATLMRRFNGQLSNP